VVTITPETRALLYCAGGGIGDSLVASVIARALRSHYTSVDALTLPGHKSTLERVPDIDRAFVDEGTERELADAVAERGYDACVVSWATARTARVPQLAKIPIRVGQARRLYSSRFTKRVVVRSEIGDVTSHWADILLDFPRAIGCDTNDPVPRFVPTSDDVREAEVVAERIGGDFIVMHPTNAVATKRGIWPTDGWIALARALAERFGMRVVVTGTNADAEIVRAICERSGALDLSGTTGIGAFGALAQRARAFVGITTGSMHVAAAVGAPTVGIFPFQSDFPERWAPLGARTAIVRPSYACHPGDTKERCPDYACIAHLNVLQIVSALESLLKRTAN
jgi:ADP-heptose:LPS heptosyltransferase